MNAAIQQPLILDGDPGSDAELRRAFAESGLPEQGYTFERALAVRSIRIALKNTVVARLRAKAINQHRSPITDHRSPGIQA